MVARLLPQILSGEKTSTIRFGERRILPGPMRYAHDDTPKRTVIVPEVRCADMPLFGMRAHYPDIELSDVVRVIEHAPCRPDEPTG